MKKMITVLLLFATVMTSLSVVSCNKEEKPQAKIIDIDLTEEEYAFGVSKEQPELLETVNELIANIKHTGTFKDICDRYFGEGTPVAIKSAELDPTKDQLVVATHAHFAPFEYKIGDNYYGIDMEIATLLADELNQELVIVDMDFKNLLSAVKNGEADIIMSGFTMKEERKEYVDFSDTYYQASQKLIVKSDDDTFDGCKTADDVLAKLRTLTMSTNIGYLQGTTGGMYVNNEGDYKKNGLKVTGTGYTTGKLAVQDILNEKIRGVVIDAGPAESIVKEVNAER